MKIYTKYNNYYVKVINQVSIVFVHTKEKADEFGSMGVSEFVSLKDRVERRENISLEVEYLS